VSALSSVYGLKRTIKRQRPDASSKLSMPSGHATHAFLYANWIDQNIEQHGLPNYAETSIEVAAYGLATLTSWSRIEGKKHYPSDVLVGAALANFFSIFISEAFLKNANEENDAFISFHVEPRGDLSFVYKTTF
jgi:membrane-associated phospholipid phosphatase